MFNNLVEMSAKKLVISLSKWQCETCYNPLKGQISDLFLLDVNSMKNISFHLQKSPQILLVAIKEKKFPAILRF